MAIFNSYVKNYQRALYTDWLVVWNMAFIFHMLGIILPFDYFSEGWVNHQPAEFQMTMDDRG